MCDLKPSHRTLFHSPIRPKCKTNVIKEQRNCVGLLVESGQRTCFMLADPPR